jgi:hypothetical protein
MITYILEYLLFSENLLDIEVKTMNQNRRKSSLALEKTNKVGELNIFSPCWESSPEPYEFLASSPPLSYSPTQR